jgi:P27 family predicted phage terminase small subunit
MTRGRKPLPTKLKVLRGTARDDRTNRDEPQPVPALPTCPEHLNDEARAEWTRLCAEMHDLGMLTKLDRIVLAAACACFARWAEAERQIAALGCVVRGTNGGAQLSPWLSVANKALEQMKGYLIELGLTPSSRSRVRVAPASLYDPFDEFLGGVKKRNRHPESPKGKRKA